VLDRASKIRPFRDQNGAGKFWSIFPARPILTRRSVPSENRYATGGVGDFRTGNTGEPADWNVCPTPKHSDHFLPVTRHLFAIKFQDPF